MSELVSVAADFAESAKGRLLHTLEAVPDDKLDWTPAPGTHGALRIAAHAALSNEHFAGMLRGTPLPNMPMEELFAQIEATEAAVSSREQVVKLIEEKTAEAVAALKELTPERIGADVQTPFGSMSVKFIMMLIGRHLDGHASQIDYLQTLWGDEKQHF